MADEGESQGTGTGETPPAAESKAADKGAEGEERFDEARAKATIQAQRQAERAAMKRAEKAETDLKALKDAQLSESEKVAARLKELEAEKAGWEAEKRAITVRDAVRAEVEAAGATGHYAAAAISVVTSQVELDAAGNPTNIKALVADAKKNTPGMFPGSAARTGGADGGAGRGNGTAPKADPVGDLFRR